MGYKGQYLTPEELDVMEALAEYGETDDDRDWVPLTALHATYRHHWHAKLPPANAEDATRLIGLREFGTAISRIYPNTLPVSRRTERNGPQRRGRACLSGPQSLRAGGESYTRENRAAKLQRLMRLIHGEEAKVNVHEGRYGPEDADAARPPEGRD